MTDIHFGTIKLIELSWILVPTGEAGCLIFANLQDIRLIQFDSSDYTELVSGQRGAIALDYDFESGYIFWTDVINETISRAKIENPKVDVLVKIDLDTPEGIAVDWVNKKLYWTDTGTDMIEVADFNGTNRLELITTGLEEPRAIVVHPALGYVKLMCSLSILFAIDLTLFSV